MLFKCFSLAVAQQEAELVKDFSGLCSTTASRGPQIISNSAISAQKDSVMSPADEFAKVAKVSMRMQKVKQKLDSVMVCMVFPH